MSEKQYWEDYKMSSTYNYILGKGKKMPTLGSEMTSEPMIRLGDEMTASKQDMPQIGVEMTSTPMTETGNKQSAPKKETPAQSSTPVEQPKKSVDERMQEWVSQNPEPTKREVEVPQLQKSLSYQDILNRYTKAQQPDPKTEKRKKINQSIAAVGDTVSALINAVGTTQRANNMPLDPTKGLSEKMRAKYLADEASAKDLRDKYFALQMKAAGLADADNEKKLSAYNSALAKADSDYNTRKRNWDSAYDRKARSYERQDAAEQKAEDAQKTQDYRDAMLGLKRQGLAEQARYHSGSLSIQKQRADNASGKGSTKYRLGDWHSDRTFSKEELATLAKRMNERHLISNSDYNAAEMGLKNFGPLIEKAARSSEGAKIMQSNGFTTNK